jgi:fumarylacetoacetase
VQDVFREPVLNGLMSLTRAHWLEARATLTSLLSADNPALRDDAALRATCLVSRAAASMHLPATIGDYTDFYSSIGTENGLFLD